MRSRSAAKCELEPTPAEAKFSAPGLRLGRSDQVAEALEALCRHGHQHQGLLPKRNHRHQILQRTVGQLRVERMRGRQGTGRQDRVTVRRGFGDDVGAESPSGSSAVFDDDRPSNLLRDLIQCDAPEDIGPAAGAERYDRRDGLCGPRLGQSRIRPRDGDQVTSRRNQCQSRALPNGHVN
jgi:hypothetical protein